VELVRGRHEDGVDGIVQFSGVVVDGDVVLLGERRAGVGVDV